jgi:hypothetical protein
MIKWVDINPLISIGAYGSTGLYIRVLLHGLKGYVHRKTGVGMIGINV